MIALLTRFLEHYDPLSRGRTPAGIAAGSVLLAGCGWCRPAGGYTLYRYCETDGETEADAVPVGASSPTAETPSVIGHWPGFAFEPEKVYRVFLRASSPGGAEENGTVQTVRVETDADGEVMPAVPDPVVRLAAWPVAEGYVRVRWSTDPRSSTAPAAGSYRIYHDNGTGTVDWATPVATVAAQGAIVGPYAHGTVVQLGVRAVSRAGNAELNTETISVTADAVGPPDLPAPSLTVGRES